MSKKTPPKTKNTRRLLPTWVLWASIALLVVLAAVVYFVPRLTKKAAQTPTPTASLPDEISVDEAYLLFNRNSVTFLDVRPASDFKAYHIGKSITIPVDELSSHLDEIPSTQTIVVIDTYGLEAANQARSILQAAGYPSVTIMAGGLDAWVQKQYPFIGTARY